MRRTILGERFHFVGIGGAGMSALARLLHQRGASVTGSDDADGPVLQGLSRLGIPVWSGSHAASIAGDGGCVVRSAAVERTHPEVEACQSVGFESLLYSEVLGRLCAELRPLAVAGTHGKTTTVALLAAALRGGGIDASHIVGGDVPDLGGSGHAGASPWLVLEACEFDRTFHRLQADGVALLNFDHDHVDCYPELGDMLAAYAGFAARVRPGGLLVVPADVPEQVLAEVGVGRQVRRVGWGPPADDHPLDARGDAGRYSFVPFVFGRRLPRVHLQLPGLFQVQNALFALTLAVWAGADAAGACRGISSLSGVSRRFELRTGPGGGELVNDYAHHPTEIDAVITTAKQRFPGRRILVVFQPHQHQRTRALLGEFAEVLCRADQSLVAEIYGARESEEIRRMTSAGDLVDAVCLAGGQCASAGSLDEIPSAVLDHYRSGDVVLVLGAGDIDRIVDDVVGLI